MSLLHLKGKDGRSPAVDFQCLSWAQEQKLEVTCPSLASSGCRNVIRVNWLWSHQDSKLNFFSVLLRSYKYVISIACVSSLTWNLSCRVFSNDLKLLKTTGLKCRNYVTVSVIRPLLA